jgi:preprotein translocase subunit YajC
MTDVLNAIAILAAEGGGAGAGGGQSPPNPMEMLWQFAPIIGILVLFFWFSMRSQKKRERERQTMLDSLKPKDDVVTIGGIHGRIVRIQDEEITIRVDADKDVKMTFSKSAVSRKLNEQAPQSPE